MVNYSSELKRVESLVKQNYYPSAVLKSFQLVEFGLKDLYKKLELYFEGTDRNHLWKELHQDFFRARKEEFIFEKAGFGSMLLLAKSTKFWDYMREMCESNLRFVRMVNWEHVRVLRNKVTHEGFQVSRSDALEMLFWSKVFLFESGLVQGRKDLITEVLDTDCIKCDFTISLSWNFCPHCGDPTHNACPSCNRDVNHSQKVCPHCDYVIVRIEKNSEEKKKYKAYAEAVWADWVVTPLEREWLKQKRLELGLTMDESETIEMQVIPKNYYLFSEIIEATKVDGKIDKFEKEFLQKKAVQLNVPMEVAYNLINAASNFRAQKSSLRKLIAMM